MDITTTETDISNDPKFHLKHPGVPDSSDGSDRTSYAVTEIYTLPITQATGRIAYVPPLLCGDVYASSERHVCYTLSRGCSYAEAVFQESIRPSQGIPAGLQSHSERQRQAWEHLESQSCIQFVFSSMNLCIYIATHLHTLYLDWLQAVRLRGRDRILPVTLSTSVTPVSLYNCHCSLKMYLIERVWDALGDVDRVNSEMHLEAVIERLWICSWRLRSCKLRDALGGRDWASLDLHFETEIEWTQRCT